MLHDSGFKFLAEINNTEALPADSRNIVEQLFHWPSFLVSSMMPCLHFLDLLLGHLTAQVGLGITVKSVRHVLLETTHELLMLVCLVKLDPVGQVSAGFHMS